jgi:hypothetical protein
MFFWQPNSTKTMPKELMDQHKCCSTIKIATLNLLRSKNNLLEQKNTILVALQMK